MRKPITSYDHANAKPIADRLHLLDYCLINDGGVAMILFHPDAARKGCKSPVCIRGCAQAAHLTEAHSCWCSAAWCGRS
jgi:hypothetical protein